MTFNLTNGVNEYKEQHLSRETARYFRYQIKSTRFDKSLKKDTF